MKLRRSLAALLSLCVAVSATACGQSGANTEPEITGVQDQSVQAGTEFDAMAGVSATSANKDEAGQFVAVLFGDAVQST